MNFYGGLQSILDDDIMGVELYTDKDEIAYQPLIDSGMLIVDCEWNIFNLWFSCYSSILFVHRQKGVFVNSWIFFYIILTNLYLI